MTGPECRATRIENGTGNRETAIVQWDGGVIEVVRDVAFSVAQACRDLNRQNVAQEVLAMPLLPLQLAQIFFSARSECLRSAAPIRARKIVGLNGFGR
jgi:hypothetical protein